jgi:GNAT superfamily N-acetyltransferase
MSSSPTRKPVIFKPASSPAEIAVIAGLAAEIWYEYYVALIGRAQVDYMVARFQSTAAMLEQVSQGYRYFTIEEEGGQPAGQAGSPLGYFAVQSQPHQEPGQGKLFISKLYLRQAGRGRGTGRQTLEFIEHMARDEALHYLWLTVNKGNPAVSTYQQWGFRVVEAIVIDIGGGFVMDDYRMEKPIDLSR